MLKRIKITDGFGFDNRQAVNIKIISAAAPVHVKAIDNNGKTVLDSELRAPQGTDFEGVSARVEFNSKVDQTIEVWLGNKPLDYVQMVAVGASRGVSKTKFAFKGVNKIADAALRKSIRVSAQAEVFVGDADVKANGWPLAANEKEDFEIAGEVYCWVPGVELLLDNVGDSVNLTAVTNPSSYQGQIARFNGETYVANGMMRKINDADGTSVAVFGAYAVTVFAGKMYVIANDSGAVLYESADGENFSALNKVASNASSAGGHEFTGIVNGIGVTGAQTGHYFLVDFTERRMYQCVSPTTDPRPVVTDGEYIYHTANTVGGAMRRISVADAKAGGEMVTVWTAGTDALSQMGVDKVTKQLYGLVGNKIRLWDGESWTGSFAQVFTQFTTEFLYIGRPAFFDSTKIVLIDGDEELVKPLTNACPSYAAYAASTDEEKVFRLQRAGASKIYQEIPVGPFDAGDPVVVKTLEFLV